MKSCQILLKLFSLFLYPTRFVTLVSLSGRYFLSWIQWMRWEKEQWLIFLQKTGKIVILEKQKHLMSMALEFFFGKSLPRNNHSIKVSWVSAELDDNFLNFLFDIIILVRITRARSGKKKCRYDIGYAFFDLETLRAKPEPRARSARASRA